MKLIFEKYFLFFTNQANFIEVWSEYLFISVCCPPENDWKLHSKRLTRIKIFLRLYSSPCPCSTGRSVLSQPTSYRPRLLLEGRVGSGQSSHLAPAVLHTLEKFTVYTLDMAVLFGTSATAPEETCAQVRWNTKDIFMHTITQILTDRQQLVIFLWI